MEQCSEANTPPALTLMLTPTWPAFIPPSGKQAGLILLPHNSFHSSSPRSTVTHPKACNTLKVRDVEAQYTS